jgi:hypothetical protein
MRLLSLTIGTINRAAERFQNTQCSDTRALIVFASIAAAVVLAQAFGWWIA